MADKRFGDLYHREEAAHARKPGGALLVIAVIALVWGLGDLLTVDDNQFGKFNLGGAVTGTIATCVGVVMLVAYFVVRRR